MKGKSKWWRIPPSFHITEREYDANVQGMNIVFGAVLGFVLAGANGLPQLDFAVVLLLSASVVVTILYLSMSEYKLFYAVTAAALIVLLPIILEEPLGIPAIPQLQPTLAVWAIMVIIVELMPRKNAQPSKENDQ